MNTKNNSDDIAYRLLDQLDRESTISQRALADRLGIALGLVNAYIKRLCSKGYIKIKTLPRNRIKYIITPKGFSEKTRLTYKFMQYSILYFNEVREKIESTYARLLEAGHKNILLWGDGELAELCYISTRGMPLEIVGAVGKKRIENGFFERHVYMPEEIVAVVYDAIVVSTLEQKLLVKLQANGIDPERVFYLEQ